MKIPSIAKTRTRLSIPVRKEAVTVTAMETPHVIAIITLVDVPSVNRLLEIQHVIVVTRAVGLVEEV